MPGEPGSERPEFDAMPSATRPVESKAASSDVPAADATRPGPENRTRPFPAAPEQKIDLKTTSPNKIVESFTVGVGLKLTESELKLLKTQINNFAEKYTNAIKNRNKTTDDASASKEWDTYSQAILDLRLLANQVDQQLAAFSPDAESAPVTASPTESASVATPPPVDATPAAEPPAEAKAATAEPVQAAESQYSAEELRRSIQEDMEDFKSRFSSAKTVEDYSRLQDEVQMYSQDLTDEMRELTLSGPREKKRFAKVAILNSALEQLDDLLEQIQPALDSESPKRKAETLTKEIVDQIKNPPEGVGSTEAVIGPIALEMVKLSIEINQLQQSVEALLQQNRSLEGQINTGVNTASSTPASNEAAPVPAAASEAAKEPEAAPQPLPEEPTVPAEVTTATPAENNPVDAHAAAPHATAETPATAKKTEKTIPPSGDLLGRFTKKAKEITKKGLTKYRDTVLDAQLVDQDILRGKNVDLVSNYAFNMFLPLELKGLGDQANRSQANKDNRLILFSESIVEALDGLKPREGDKQRMSEYGFDPKKLDAQINAAARASQLDAKAIKEALSGKLRDLVRNARTEPRTP